MFREMRREKQLLTREECQTILEQEKRGVLSVLGDGGYPYGLPVNHYYSRQEDRLYFHGARAGHKIDAIRRCDKASFCVWDQGWQHEGDWALNIRSVIVFGRIRPVEDRETLCRIARLLCLKFTDDEAFIRYNLDRYAAATLMFSLEPEHMTGKLVNES